MPDINQFDDISIGLLFGSMIFLVVLLALILLMSLYYRWKSAYKARLEKRLNERFYPLIFGYLEGELSLKQVTNGISGYGYEYGVFERTVEDLILKVSGDDKERLRQLLYIDPLFKYHLKNLMSKRIGRILKACNYFGYTHLINYKVITRLKKLTVHKNRIVAFVACSALMASKSVSDRADGLWRIVGRSKYSEMAILELMYEFKNNDKDQSEEEIEYLKKIIEDETIPEDMKSIIILAIQELGYYQLQGYLFSLLSIDTDYWKQMSIRSSIIIALGKFGYEPAEAYIRQLALGENDELSRSAIEALSALGGAENFDFIITQISDDNLKNEFILKSMLSNGFDQEEITNTLDLIGVNGKSFNLMMDAINQKPLSV